MQAGVVAVGNGEAGQEAGAAVGFAEQFAGVVEGQSGCGAAALGDPFPSSDHSMPSSQL